MQYHQFFDGMTDVIGESSVGKLKVLQCSADNHQPVVSPRLSLAPLEKGVPEASYLQSWVCPSQLPGYLRGSRWAVQVLFMVPAGRMPSLRDINNASCSSSTA